MKTNVIFICHGNVNRSKMAEALLRFLRPDLIIDSYAVGVKSKAGNLITKKTRDLLTDREIPFDPQSRSKVITEEAVDLCDNVFVMDKNNIKHYKNRFGIVSEVPELKLLYSVLDSEKGIKDPGFSKGTEMYERCFDEIFECCEKLSMIL